MGSRFTVTQIRAFKPKTRKYYKTESGSGLVVSIFSNGRKSFLFRYTRPDRTGRRTFMVLGEFPDFPLVDAREKASELMKLVRSGVDPSKIKKKQIRERSDAPDMKRLWELFDQDMSTARKRRNRGSRTPISPRTLYSYQGYWRRRIAPEIGAYPVIEIKRADIRALFVKASRHGEVEANRTLALVRRLFNYGIDELDGFGGLEYNPAQRIKMNPVYPRDRVLAAKEIRAAWVGMCEEPPAFEGAKYDKRNALGIQRAAAFEIVGLALRMMLVTMQRGVDIRLIRDEHLDEEERSWIIPGELYKTSLPHRVPLCDMALDLIRQARTLRPKNCPYVFGSPITGEPLTGTALSQRVRDSFERWEVLAFTPHDLRRTASTFANAAGADAAHTDILLGHYPSGIRRVYDRYAYDREKRLVIEIWESKLKAVIEGRDQKVIPIRALRFGSS